MEEDRRELESLWAYYTAAAEIRGRSGRERTVPYEDRLLYPQSAFSLYWFFWQDPAGLNPLTRAFLGDREAMETLAPEGTPPEGQDRWRLEGFPLDENQEAAIRAALSAPVSFIQGPPGTGKTETILNLANRAARLGKTVAIVSTNNSALENIVEKINDPKADGQPGWDWLRRHFARLGNKKNRQEFRGAGPREFRFQNTREAIGPLTVSREGTIGAEDFLGEYPVITSTIHSLKHCFRDGLAYLYDYVIMDESSQTDGVAGLVAMSAAKRLVLVGDPKQLPPVISSDFAQELAARAAEEGWALPKDHLVREDRSFLDVCLDVFGERTAKTVLRCHYRCHPGIIGFCAKEVYKEEGLKICTPNYDQTARVPVKVLWFEGNYCERRALPAKEGEAARVSKHNQKQVRCFMEEEWPRLRERVLEENPPSVCILSPFRGQLASLDEAIRADLARHRRGAEVVLEDRQSEEEGYEPPMLTIHKAQGRGYDIIYLLPVEDGDWEWPWSQKMRLINVAVSRAKKELRVILSTALMERGIQEELTGGYIRPEEGDAAPGEEKDQRFLQKLVGYIREENLSLEQETGVRGYPKSQYEYGFHPSARRSVFDQLPQKRQESPREEDRSKPERCVEAALEKLLADAKEKGIDLALYRNVPLRVLRDGKGALPRLGQDRQELVSIWEKGHLDFVICRKIWEKSPGGTSYSREKLLLAVEVDGEYHRKPGPEGDAQRKRDERKNTLAREVLGADCYDGNRREGQEVRGAGAFAFLRLPTDGTACLETRALWQEAPEELQSRYFPLEDLLEARLEQTREDGWYLRVDLLSWLCAQDSCKEKSLQRAYLRLVAAGLLGEDRTPTGKGQELGLIHVTRAIQLPYYNIAFPRENRDKILELLSRPEEGAP